jgi:hypothetical protein
MPVNLLVCFNMVEPILRLLQVVSLLCLIPVQYRWNGTSGLGIPNSRQTRYNRSQNHIRSGSSVHLP